MANLGLVKHWVSSMVQFVLFGEYWPNASNDCTNQAKHARSSARRIQQKNIPKNNPMPRESRENSIGAYNSVKWYVMKNSTQNLQEEAISS
jgi:hypothetical protein